MRAYVPATVDLLKTWAAAGVIPADVSGYAVTDAVVAAFPDEIEEQEYAATILAADESVVLLAESPSTPCRRVVLAVDADATVVDGAQVGFASDIAWSDVAALLVDDAGVTAAVSDALESGDVDGLDDFALLWFAPDELDQI